MAKRQRFEMDDYGFSNDLDMPDLDFDVPEIKDDRQPAVKLKDAVLQGAKDTAKSPDFIRQVMKKSLPKGYGQALDLADQSASTLKNLYNTTEKEIKPVLQELKRVTKRVLPHTEAILPRSMAEKIKQWAENSGSDQMGSMLDQQAQRDAALQTQLAEIFQLQTEAELDKQSKDDAEGRIQEGIAQIRHRDQLGQLDAMRVSLQQLANYQTKIESVYQRKSLELQFRHYFVAQDMLAEQKRANAESKLHLEGILKNTGLPEYAKIKLSESYKEIARNKFLGGLHNTVFGNRTDFLRNFGDNLIKQLKEKLSKVTDDVKAGLSGVDMAMDMQDLKAEMAANGMEMPSNMEIAGGMVGGLATDTLGKRLGKWANKKLADKPKILEYGNKASYFAENLPQIANEWAQGSQGDELPLLGGLMRASKDAILASQRVDNSLIGDSASAMQDPAILTRQQAKSINEIIPGYLARIYRELQMTRTGDESIDLTLYDFSANKFADKTSVAKNLFKKLISKHERASTKEAVDELINDVDPEKQLSDEQRQALGMQMLRDNMQNRTASAKRLSDIDSYTKEARPHAELFSELFTNYFKDDATSEKQVKFARKFSNLGRYIGDSRKEIQDNVNLGNRDLLEEMGILDPESDTINMEKLYEYYYHADYTPNQKRTPYRLKQRRDNAKPVRSVPVQSRLYSDDRPAPYVGGGADSARLPDRTDRSNSELIAAIKESSAKSVSESIHETLLRIEKQLERGVGGGAGHSGDSAGKPWWDRSLKDTGRGLLGLGQQAWARARDSVDSVKNRIKGWGQQGLAATKTGFGWLKGKYQEINDIYVQGELVPRLLAAKLKAGEYRDQLTGQVIKTYKDIKGAVVDENGNIVLSAEDVKNAFAQSNFVQKSLKSLGAALKSTKDFALGLPGQARQFVGGLYGVGLDWAIKGWAFAKKQIHRPRDVYVKGKLDPILLAITMKAGGYTSAVSGKRIEAPEDIDGPVKDHDGNIVLTAEQLASGLFDKDGKPLRLGVRGIFGQAKDLALGAVDKVKKGLGWLRDKASGLWDKAKGAFSHTPGGGLNILSGNSLGGGLGANRILLQIRDMLNDRLPGERTEFDDANPGSGMGRGLGQRLSSYFARSKDRFQAKLAAAKDRLQEFRDKHRDTLPTLQADLQGKVPGFKDKVREKVASAWERTKGLFGSFAKKDGLAVSGITSMQDLLKEIRDRLPKKKKRIIGDRDDDGVREGSYEDLMRKKGFLGGKKKPEEAAAAAPAAAKGLGLMGGLRSMWNKVRGKGEEGEGDTAINVLNPGMGGEPKSPAPPPGKKPPPKGFWGKAKHYGAKAGRGLWGATKWLGKGALTLAGLGGLGMLSGVGGALAGAGSAIAGGLAAAGTAIAGVISAPVVLGALAVAAVAGAGYLAYKHFTRKTLGLLSKIRYAQYGFRPSDTDHLQKVFGLEDDLMPGVSWDGSVARLDDKKIDLKKMIDNFGIDVEDEAQTNAWLVWFGSRFKPFFLTHLSALKSVASKKTLDEVDKGLTPEEQKKYLDIAKWPGGPYDIFVSPFSDLKQLTVGRSDVMELVKAAEAEIGQRFKDGKISGKAALTETTGATAATAGTAALALSPKDGASTTNPAPMVNATKASLLKAVEPTATTGLATGATLSVSGTALPGNSFTVGRIDALSCVRFKTYGLVEMEADKVRCLDILEKEVLRDVKYGKGFVAKWDGSVEAILQSMAPLFGVEISSETAIAWQRWFATRFLPTYLNYITAIASITSKPSLETGLMTLKPQDAVDVARAMYTSKADSGSVWQVTVSPWPRYEMNTDVQSVDKNVQGLKDKAEQVALDEEVSTATKAGLKKETEEKPKGFWSSIGSGFKKAGSAIMDFSRSTADTVSGIVSRGASAAAAGASAAASALGFTGGREINHPGKGSGGDINQIPQPKGSGSWEAVKDTIIAAARMVGVDEKLLGTIAAIESGFKTTVKAATSSATGLFQFISGTWKTMLKKYGAKYGLAPDTPATDARANALMGAEFTRENLETLKSSLGRAVTDVDVYMAHFLGAGGAKKFLKAMDANPNAIAAQSMTAEARANPSIFYDKSSRPRTFAEVYALMGNKVQKKQVDPNAGSEAIVSKETPPATPAGEVTEKPASQASGGSPTAPIIPISEQTPGVAAPTAPAVASATPAAVPAGSATPAAPAVDPAVAAASRGFSPRALDITAQQQYRREEQTASLGNVGDILTQSLTVYKDQLDVLIAIRDLVAAKNAQPVAAPQSAEAASAPKPNIVSTNASPVQRMNRPPVSMAKTAY